MYITYHRSDHQYCVVSYSSYRPSILCIYWYPQLSSQWTWVDNSQSNYTIHWSSPGGLFSGQCHINPTPVWSGMLTRISSSLYLYCRIWDMIWAMVIGVVNNFFNSESKFSIDNAKLCILMHFNESPSNRIVSPCSSLILSSCSVSSSCSSSSVGSSSSAACCWDLRDCRDNVDGKKGPANVGLSSCIWLTGVDLSLSYKLVTQPK